MKFTAAVLALAAQVTWASSHNGPVLAADLTGGLMLDPGNKMSHEGIEYIPDVGLVIGGKWGFRETGSPVNIVNKDGSLSPWGSAPEYQAGSLGLQTDMPRNRLLVTNLNGVCACVCVCVCVPASCLMYSCCISLLLTIDSNWRSIHLIVHRLAVRRFLLPALKILLAFRRLLLAACLLSLLSRLCRPAITVFNLHLYSLFSTLV
jgi:hypothetical protein